MKKTYNLADGKYTLVRDDGYKLEALRYDEPWQAMTDDLVGNNLIHALLNRIDELEKEVSDFGWEREYLSNQIPQDNGGWK